MNWFSWLRRKDDTHQLHRFVDTIFELNEAQEQISILNRALSDCCYELYKHTGDDKYVSDFFINAVKNRYGYIQGKIE